MENRTNENGTERKAQFNFAVFAAQCWTWLQNNPALFIMMPVIVLLALIPLYGVLFPAPTDLTQQLLVSKLLWEELAGVSQLDLEVSTFLGYRLFSYLAVVVIAVCKTFGISLVYLPKITAIMLIVIHAIVVVAVLYFGLKEKSWQSQTQAVCLMLPAAVAMYSACWFIGFVGFTLGITLLVPAIFFTEKFLRDGKQLDAALLFLFLALVYSSHPFPLAFWAIWCFSRAVAAVALGSILREWQKIILLGVIFLPIFLYHYLATKIYQLAPANVQTLQKESPFVTFEYWYQERFLGLLNGIYLKADDASDTGVFAVVAVGLILFSTVLALSLKENFELKKAAVSSVLLLLIASWINEKFIPVPEGHWLAYDYRFSSSVYVICLAVAGMILIRALPAVTDKSQYKIIFGIAAFVSVFASVEHLIDVQKAYVKFDAPARQYIAKVFNHEPATEIVLPYARWYPDGTHLRRYICLQQPDCNPTGTLFRNLGGDIYPVRVKSNRRILPADAPPVSAGTTPVSPFKGGEGFGGGQFSKPRGITVDAAGNLYVSDTGNGRLQKFDANGNFVFAFGRMSDGEAELTEPNGIAVDNAGNIYVVDAKIHKLMKFDADGKFVKEWKQAQTGFFGARDIVFGQNQQLYMIDQGAGRIVRFDPATEKFSSWGSGGAAESQFAEATGISISGNLIFVADLGNNRVQIFDLEGKFIKQFEIEPWDRYHWNYADIAFDEETKRLYATNGWRKEILVYDFDGNFIEAFKPVPPAELNNASALVLVKNNAQKLLYVLNTGSDAFDLGEPKVTVFDLGVKHNN